MKKKDSDSSNFLQVDFMVDHIKSIRDNDIFNSQFDLNES